MVCYVLPVATYCKYFRHKEIKPGEPSFVRVVIAPLEEDVLLQNLDLKNIHFAEQEGAVSGGDTVHHVLEERERGREQAWGGGKN